MESRTFGKLNTTNPAASQGSRGIFDFSFTGKASEYFGIWIVNLLLSIVTLGIYTAWAKVRRLRYFYGNTWLDGHNFEYHAKPMQILIGRIIVVGILVVGNVLANVSPILAGAMLIPYLLAFPWLLNKAFQFNARMSSYRNVHFGFVGSYGRALWVFAILPLLVPLVFGGLALGYFFTKGVDSSQLYGEDIAIYGVLGGLFMIATVLITPVISKQTNSYIANGMRFGAASFHADIRLGALYRNLGVALLGLIGVLVAAAIIGGAGFFVLGASVESAGAGAAGFAGLEITQIVFIVIYVSVPVAYLMYSAGVRNIAFNATEIEGGHGLLSGVPRLGYAWIVISNLLVSVLTIGLMIPWAAIRTWRYLVEYSAVDTASGLDQFVADQEAEGNVIAAEYLDIDGIDFGL